MKGFIESSILLIQHRCNNDKRGLRLGLVLRSWDGFPYVLPVEFCDLFIQKWLRCIFYVVRFKSDASHALLQYMKQTVKVWCLRGCPHLNRRSGRGGEKIHIRDINRSPVVTELIQRPRLYIQSYYE
jgi:hypothetical protein